MFSRILKIKKPLLSVGLITMLLAAMAGSLGAAAQSSTVITLSVPSVWEDILTDDVLARFEAQYPGLDVYVDFTPGFFFGGGDGGALENRLSNAEDTVSAGDVVYVDSSRLFVEATQAGYFLDLAPLANSDPNLNSGDFISPVWQSYQWNGGIWALPLSTDVILVTYDPAAFDQAGVAYPNDRWTVDDFASAARQLTQYNADGTVAVPGMTTISGGNNTGTFMRSLLSGGLYDANSIPNPPQFTDPNLEHILQVWYEALSDTVIMTNDNRVDVDLDDIPLRIEGRFGYSQGFNNNNDPVRYASPLPNGTAGLNVQGFAVSSGTFYPEQAYALASFLTTLPEIANNTFSTIPARQSLIGQTAAATNGGPGGGPGFGGGTVPEEIQTTINQVVYNALPVSELRYAGYLTDAVSDMLSSGVDALTALQTVEAQAFTDMQTAIDTRSTVAVAVATPIPTPQIAPGEIVLTFGYNSGFGGPGGAGQIPNENEWQQLVTDFSANSPVVGNVVIEATQETDLATLSENYSCFVLSSNVVPGNDLSTILNLDPLLDTDPTFDRNDVLGNTLTQLQQDNRTWAIPLALQPQLLSYDPELFTLAGAVQPTNGWTVDAFIDALQRLKPILEEDTAPFIPNDPTGAYITLLIASFGGIPIDYRTDPPTLNYTHPATVAAIQQVLDLAKDGYIQYDALSQFGGGGRFFIGGDATVAITTSALNRFRRIGGPGDPNARQTAYTFYPMGSQFNVMAYDITTGYISANAENPEACYAWLSTLSQNPQLFSGMPARRSFLNDPVVQAAQGAELVTAYQQLDAMLQSPNTLILPVTSLGGANAANFLTEYWLKRAFDRYVLEDADLVSELGSAQVYTEAYLGCIQNVVPPLSASGGFNEEQFQYFQELQQCATTVDSSVALTN